MIALLLLCNRDGIDIDTYKKTFTQICEFYAFINSSHSKLCLIFIKNCKLNDYFSSVLQHLIDLLFGASTDKYEFINKIKFLNMVFIEIKMWKIFEASLEYLFKKDRHTYELFLLNLKLYLEELEESKSRKFHEYEVTRLEKLQNIDTVVLEGYCSNCKDLSSKSMKIMDYLREYVQACVWLRNLSYVLCPRCIKGYLHFEQIVESPSQLEYFDNTVLNENQSIEKEMIKRIFDFDKEDKIIQKNHNNING